jgi:hypothetical protein
MEVSGQLHAPAALKMNEDSTSVTTQCKATVSPVDFKPICNISSELTATNNTNHASITSIFHYKNRVISYSLEPTKDWVEFIEP